MIEIPAAEKRAALDELTKSLGWQVFIELLGEEFGPEAQVYRIQLAVNAMAPQDIEGHNAVVAQILAGSRAIERAKTLPTEHIRRLDAGEATAKREAKSTPNPLQRFYRGPRTA